MAITDRTVSILALGIAALCLWAASPLLIRRGLKSLDLHSPKPPGPPIFAGNLTNGGRLLRFTKPKYPRELRYLGYQTILLRCKVLQDGKVAEITHVDGPAQLFPYAKAAVERWQYEPLRLYDPFTGRSDAISYVVAIQVPFYGTWP